MKKKKKYPCSECDHHAISRSGLTQHRRAVHQGKKYQYKDCDHQEYTQDILTVHQRAFHEGKKYQCRECSHKFTTICKLSGRQYMKKYLCMECEYQATSNTHLKRHQQAIHQGRKYWCRECKLEACSIWTTKSNSWKNQVSMQWPWLSGNLKEPHIPTHRGLA